MLIKIVLFILLFLWVVKQPDAYRAAVSNKVFASDTSANIKQEEKEKTKTFLEAVHKFKAGNAQRTQAIIKLAEVRQRELLFNDAERLYELALIENKAKQASGADFTKTILNLAGVLTAEEKFDEAIEYYQKVLLLDKTHLQKNDSCIARDYNNLGLASYLKASSKDRGSERLTLLRGANDYFDQALQIYRLKPDAHQGISVALWNQYLCLRDLGEEKKANLVKAEAQAIDSKSSRLYKLP